jgi:hypothetical protein
MSASGAETLGARAAPLLIPLEIELATQQIKEALWSDPADIERARLLNKS